MAEGGIFTSPTVRLIGEGGPEAVVPLPKMSPQIIISGPLVEIKDSMIDRPMADYIRKEVARLLESVLVEATSSGAPATSKRIVI
jgi:hypothetical protein